MEADLKKWSTGIFATVAIIVGYVSFAFMFQISSRFDLESRLADIDLWMRGISVVLGAVAFFGLKAWPYTSKFIDEVVFEASRVTWPKTPEAIRNTWVVFVFVAVAGMILGFLDVFWAWGVRAIF